MRQKYVLTEDLFVEPIIIKMRSLIKCLNMFAFEREDIFSVINDKNDQHVSIGDERSTICLECRRVI